MVSCSWTTESKNNLSWTEPLVISWSCFYSEQGQVKSDCSGPCQIKFWLSRLDSQVSLGYIFQCLIILSIKRNKSIYLIWICYPGVIQTCYPAETPAPIFYSVSALCIGAQGWSLLAVRILFLCFFLTKFGPLSIYMN